MPVRYRELGQTGIEVSEVSMGLWAIAGGTTWGDQDERDAVRAIHRAIDEGINFFDTAEAYGGGYSEEVLGRALDGRRQKVVLATKVSAGNLRPGDLRRACEDSLRRLKTDCIDLYYIHWPNREVPIADTLGAMEDLKRQGKIRVKGCSNFGVGDLGELLEHGRVEANQLPYSLLWRAIEYGLRDLCAKERISINCYSPLAQGLLTGKFASPDEVPDGRARTRHFSGERPHTRHGEEGAEGETFEALGEIRSLCREIGESMARVSLAWLLNRTGVTSVIAGARNPRQVRENARASELELPGDVDDRLTAATGRLKGVLGENPDMWTVSRYR